MAIAIVSGNRGTANEKVADASIAVTPSGTIAAGNYAMCFVVADNVRSPDSSTNTDISVSDTNGNTWTRLREHNGPAASPPGALGVAIFITGPLAANLDGTDTVTVTWGFGTPTAKAIGLAELSGNAIVLSTSGAISNSASAATSYSAALASLTSVPGLYIGMASGENEVGTAVTLDASYTELAFGLLTTGTGGAAASNVVARVGTLANTSTGDTFDNSGLTSADRVTILLRLEETPVAIPRNPAINFQDPGLLMRAWIRRPWWQRRSGLLVPNAGINHQNPAVLTEGWVTR